MYMGRIQELAEIVSRSPNDEDADSVAEVVSAALYYVSNVVTMEQMRTIGRSRLEPENYRTSMERIDRQRRTSHDSLMATMNVVNRLAQLHGLDDIFVFEHRKEAAAIAGQIVQEFFESGIA